MQKTWIDLLGWYDPIVVEREGRHWVRKSRVVPTRFVRLWTFDTEEDAVESLAHWISQTAEAMRLNTLQIAAAVDSGTLRCKPLDWLSNRTRLRPIF